MPDEYRARLIKFIEMHGNSELMGVLPERDWILRAPTLQRKLALTAKIQDEVGHAQLIYRVVEDLGKPRSACLDDLVSGKAKFHNVFHYPTKTWGDVGVIAWLVDAAAIVSQKALLKCSYAPYARIMKKICWEESFHILHGRDVILAMVTGTQEQFALVQEALDRWWEPLMHFHGTRSLPTRTRWCLADQERRRTRRRASSSSTATCRRSASSGSTIPDPALRKDEETGTWLYTEPDWEKLRAVVTGHGPASAGASCVPEALARGRRLGRAGGARGGRVVVFEVFRQERKGQPFQHAGSVAAPDETFAEIYAREQYARRQESVALWLVPRDAVQRDRRVPRRVRDEVPARRRLLDQGAPARSARARGNARHGSGC